MMPFRRAQIRLIRAKTPERLEELLNAFLLDTREVTAVEIQELGMRSEYLAIVHYRIEKQA